MVKQTRIIFGVGDIISVRIQCKGCQGEVICPLDEKSHPPNICPCCGVSWRGPNTNDFVDAPLIDELRKTLRYSASPVNLLFEMNGDEESDR